MIKVRALSRAERHAALHDVAQLRIEVFRHWPYLYDGDLDYEAKYLRPYAESDRALIVGAFDGQKLVGAATGSPLLDHADDFAAAFAGADLGEIFYCAESVLLPDYRGHGVGHGFFDARESHARALGFKTCVFCSVIRPENHPDRPANPRSLAPFWRGRGYAPLPGVVAQFSWKDIGTDKETLKELQFWGRELD